MSQELASDETVELTHEISLPEVADLIMMDDEDMLGRFVTTAIETLCDKHDMLEAIERLKNVLMDLEKEIKERPE